MAARAARQRGDRAIGGCWREVTLCAQHASATTTRAPDASSAGTGRYASACTEHLGRTASRGAAATTRRVWHTQHTLPFLLKGWLESASWCARRSWPPPRRCCVPCVPPLETFVEDGWRCAKLTPNASCVCSVASVVCSCAPAGCVVTASCVRLRVRLSAACVAARQPGDRPYDKRGRAVPFVRAGQCTAEQHIPSSTVFAGVLLRVVPARVVPAAPPQLRGRPCVRAWRRGARQHARTHTRA